MEILLVICLIILFSPSKSFILWFIIIASVWLNTYFDHVENTEILGYFNESLLSIEN